MFNECLYQFIHEKVSAASRIASEKPLEGEHRFSISLIRNQLIDQRSFNWTVIELVNLSREFDECDGWETHIVRQQQSPERYR
jgi:hypothetical protein